MTEDYLEDEHEPWYKGPLRIIVGLFLLLLIILWVFPHYAIKQNPEPGYIPTLDDLQFSEEIPSINSTDIKDYVLVTSELKQYADRVVTLSCKETHRVCNAKALFYFVQQNFNYLNDPLAFEYFKTPQESLATDSGDCDDASILLSSLLQSVGFQTRFVFVPGHVYIQAKIPEAVASDKDENDWVSMDATCNGCGFGEVHYSYSGDEKRYLE